jgi:hypothetical protein
MACHHCNLLYRKAGFEEPARTFMAQVVKTQILEIDSVARPMKSGSDGFRVVGKYTTDAACDNSLFENELPCVIACRIEERDYLMVSVLPSRVFAIANSDHSLREVDIGPFYPANLCLAHCGRYCEANDPSERYKLLGVRLGISD